MNTHSEESGHLPIPGRAGGVSPRPAALGRSKTRNEVMRAIRSVKKQVAKEVGQGLCSDTIFGTALAGLSGYLQDVEPALSDALWDLLQEVRKAGVSS